MAKPTSNDRPLKPGDVIYLKPGYDVKSLCEDMKGGKGVDTAAVVVCRSGRLGYVWLNDESFEEEKDRDQNSCRDFVYYLDVPEDKVEWYSSQSAAVRAFLRSERRYLEGDLRELLEVEAAVEEYFGSCRGKAP